MIEFGIPFLFIIIVGFVALVLKKSLYIVQQAEVIIIERVGRFDRILYPGLQFVTPFVEQPRQVAWTHVAMDSTGKKYIRSFMYLDRIDLREAVYDFPKQNVITRDNVTIEINALLYYQITDPKAAVYEVSNLPEAIEKLTQTTLRNVVGHMDLDETLISRDQVNEKLRLILDEATDKWGVKINRVELQEVNPPVDIRHAMEKQMRAERDRRATILESEGKKSAAILEAEGEQESNILRARGQAEAQMIRAEAEAISRFKIVQAEAQSVEVLSKVMPHGDPAAYMVAIQYIKALPELTKGKDDKLVIIPYETSALLSSLAPIKKLFESINK